MVLYGPVANAKHESVAVPLSGKQKQPEAG